MASFSASVANSASKGVTKEELRKPFTYDPSRLGYRPSYPEEERQRAAIRDGVVDLVAETRRRHAENRPAVGAESSS